MPLSPLVYLMNSNVSIHLLINENNVLLLLQFKHFQLYLLLHDLGIAKHFRCGNQEDAHEFLRYIVDAMQKSCLPPNKWVCFNIIKTKLFNTFLIKSNH